MLIIILFMSLVFLLIGFAVTEKNAKYLLSGYNTMSEKERANFDLPGFLKLFKVFHVGLAIVFLISCLLMYVFTTERILAMNMSLLPIVGYLYLLWQSKSYYHDRKLPALTKVGIGFMLAIGVLLAILFLFL